jgi:hypothetical protein
MGISNPEIQKKVFGARWEHEIESKAGRSGKGSCTDCRTVLYASPNHNLETFNERFYRLVSTVDEMIENGWMLVELTKDELCIINNALNEVCNGIDLEGEFDTRMGCTVEEAQAVLAKIHGLATSQ